MPISSDIPAALHTQTGEHPLHEYRLTLDGRTWSILHTNAVLSHVDELRYLGEQPNRPPYGVALWPAAIALAHEIASRSVAVDGMRVLELGAGTGLPGIVAASFGARVLQTDRHELALSLCRRNAERNGADAIEHRIADWTTWDDEARYDIILGSDILYAPRLHPALRRILETNLAPHGRALLADPFRPTSLELLEAMEKDGWSIVMAKWNVGGETGKRGVGVYEVKGHCRT